LTALAQLSTSFTLANWTAQSFEEQQSTLYYPWMFAGSVALYILCCLMRAIVTYWMIGVSTTNLHNAVSKRVIRSVVLFFDSNPVGRIVTRFSKDVTVLDFIIPVYVVFIAQGMFRSLTVTVTVGIINPWLFIAVAVAIALMVFILKKGVKPM
jgi:ATP-binding cassette subfamily C (CFTR/MRP) protein 4